ncbi:sensor histidine kinase [Clostridium sp. C2-6-12]|uniref:sensor histidine kinase n=1 Tax=Clostridium sp. C2-6-12 TaxID=2698832 RepID=UPI001FAD39A4|nr:sensor histidine kinase [Clostridium sp. C2-6-12]
MKNNKSINLRILILSLCIIMLPILLGIYRYFHDGDYSLYVGSYFLFFLVIIIMILLLIDMVQNKTLIFKETSITKLYNGIFLEIRAFLTIVIILSWLWLYRFVAHSLNAFTFTLLTIFTFMLLYLALIDIYKLYLLNRANSLENHIYERSILYKLYKLVRECFLTKSIALKIIIFIAVYILYVILVFIIRYLVNTDFDFPPLSLSAILDISLLNDQFLDFILFSIIPIIYLIYSFIQINKISTYTYNVANGNYNTKIDISKQLLFKDIIKNISNIENGLNKALDKAVKSEKMKGELITNVSHDLKTPLTSIINYVDLLDNENISDEKRKAYLGILKERSQRLKVLIEDLFEASKAASGNLEMHMEDIDPVALLRQTLGEFEDKIQMSDFEFIKKIPDKKINIYADGRKTFRVLQNLISNILKYSLNGTRVYIDVEEHGDFVSITFKNISKYPLNFTEEEILERFKRGDSARTTEGSGLGLSIAKSLVELQGGIFELKFDGDLFKVIILLKKQKI